MCTYVYLFSGHPASSFWGYVIETLISIQDKHHVFCVEVVKFSSFMIKVKSIFDTHLRVALIPLFNDVDTLVYFQYPCFYLK